MTGKPELLVQREGHICTLVINRPEKRNFLVPEFLLKMADVIEDLSKEDLVRVLEKALLSIRDFPYPVIAMLNGHAFGGGCELAIGCDIRVAAKRTKMGMPPAKLGLVYPYQEYRRFLTVLGFARTLEIFLTGRSYDSQSCLTMGLVNYVVDDADIESFTYELAVDLANNSPLSLRGTKSALYKIAEYPILKRDDEDALRSLFIQSLQSEDMEEGKRAFMEKRTPHFKGR